MFLDLPDPDPQVVGYGSGSFHHKKIARKTLISSSSVLGLLYDFLSLKNDVNECTFKK
jgi:hypothetical protein